MHEQNHERTRGRLSIPLDGSRVPLTEEALMRHSYDLSLFPLYLIRKVAHRVAVQVCPNSNGDPDLMAVYQSPSAGVHRLYARLKPDEDGTLTDSDDLYLAIHAAFEAHAGDAKYLGFTRYGRPPHAPPFALALLYSKYGRGLYRAGEMLPTPWPSLTCSYRLN